MLRNKFSAVRQCCASNYNYPINRLEGLLSWNLKNDPVLYSGLDWPLMKIDRMAEMVLSESFPKPYLPFKISSGAGSCTPLALASFHAALAESLSPPSIYLSMIFLQASV